MANPADQLLGHRREARSGRRTCWLWRCNRALCSSAGLLAALRYSWKRLRQRRLGDAAWPALQLTATEAAEVARRPWGKVRCVAGW